MTIAKVDDVIAKLSAALAAMLDPLDIPRTWTQRQVGAYERRRHRLNMHISGLRNASASKAEPLHAKRDELLTAKVSLEKQIADAPDWRTIDDGRERDKEFDRQQWLQESLKALYVGVGYWPNGAPMIPQPLGDPLRKTCAACGHTTLEWPGTIPEVEAQVVAMEEKVKEERAHLDALLAGAAALLAESVASETAASQRGPHRRGCGGQRAPSPAHLPWCSTARRRARRLCNVRMIAAVRIPSHCGESGHAPISKRLVDGSRRSHLGSGLPLAPRLPSGLRYWWTIATAFLPFRYTTNWLRVQNGTGALGDVG